MGEKFARFWQIKWIDERLKTNNREEFKLIGSPLNHDVDDES